MDDLLKSATTLGVPSVIALYLVWRMNTNHEKKLDQIVQLLIQIRSIKSKRKL
jgi:hypothetical protein